MGILGFKRNTQETPMNVTVETATSMLARNIIFDATSANVTVPSLLPLKDFLPRSDAGVFLRMLCERSRGQMLNAGMVEEVLEAHPGKAWSRSMRLRAVGDSRSAVESYIETIRQSAIRDRLIAVNAEVGLMLTNESVPIDRIQRFYLDGISKTTTLGGGVVRLGAHGAKAKEYIEQVMNGNRPGCSAGLGPQLDEFYWYDPACLTVLGGCPGAGKTAFAVSSMVAMAMTGKRALFFSIEMPGYQVALRTACIICNIPYWKVRRGYILPAERDLLTATIDALDGMGIFIDDGQNSIEDVYFKSASQEEKPDVIHIDYAELVVTDGDSDRSDLLLGRVFVKGKQVAKALDTHTVVLSQLKRDVDMRPDKWPMMRDFSGTKYAEQAADYGLLLMRPQYYYDRGLQCRVLDSRDTNGCCYAIVAKSRNDQSGVVTLGMDAELMKFHGLNRDATANRLQENEQRVQQDASE